MKISKKSKEEDVKLKECYGTDFVEPKFETYTVTENDNLFSIAQKFNTSVDNLIALNKLSSTNLKIGQILKVKEII